jgi:hypothetical protein
MRYVYCLLALVLCGVAVTAHGQAPVITRSPTFAILPLGADASFRVEASGSGLTYEWRKNDVVIPGASDQALSLSKVQRSDEGRYHAIVRNGSGSAVSFPADLYVVAATITRSRQVVAGDTVTLSSAVTTTAPVRYRWFKDHQPLQGAASSSLVLPGVRAADAGIYSLSLTTGSGVPIYAETELATTLIVQTGPLPAINRQPLGGTFATGSTVTLSFDVAGGPYTYQWQKNGVALPNETGPGLMLANLQAALAGEYRVTVAGSFGMFFSDTADVKTGDFAYLANVSTRGLAGSGSQALIAGFVIGGEGVKDVLIRASGPALAGFGVTGALANPRLKLFRGSALLMENDDWESLGTAAAIAAVGNRLGAFSFAAGSSDAALLIRLAPDVYSAQISSDSGAAGIGLIEVYDATAPTLTPAGLINLSTRGTVGAGNDVLIVGFVVTGNQSKKMLVRGVGPALTGFGVSGALATPRLRLYRGDQLVQENSGWSFGSGGGLIAAAATQVGAFPLPEGSKDTALLLNLAPGSYTAQISGLNATTGVALVEVYEVP